MVSLLSIDFDYFIDASSSERDAYFPDGSDGIPKGRLQSMWEYRYKKYPRLLNFGVTKEYYLLRDYFLALKYRRYIFHKAEAHRNIKQIIDAIPLSAQLMIVNIDFHHDYYHYYTGTDYYNCGNWLRRTVEARPDTTVKWIRREDSQLISLEGEFPFEHTTDIKSVFTEKFDYVFLCRSPEWSPPHFSAKFEELAWAAGRYDISLKTAHTM